ncbi:rCG27030 [Rattus norvegicus]|uniref:RCG27030 n=1 Tax=Rattus norvegicus TaxID=10116 RepID=A6HPA5_RAT|nr:rCG27030 [Rattus norvegicus]
MEYHRLYLIYRARGQQGPGPMR